MTVRRRGEGELFEPVSPSAPLDDDLVMIPSYGVDNLTALVINMILIDEIPNRERIGMVGFGNEVTSEKECVV